MMQLFPLGTQPLTQALVLRVQPALQLKPPPVKPPEILVQFCPARSLPSHSSPDSRVPFPQIGLAGGGGDPPPPPEGTGKDRTQFPGGFGPVTANGISTLS